MGWHDEDDQRSRAWLEPFAWVACLVSPVMPVILLTGLAQRFDAAIWPPFVPALYIGLFTLMVLIVRPWTVR